MAACDGQTPKSRPSPCGPQQVLAEEHIHPSLKQEKSHIIRWLVVPSEAQRLNTLFDELADWEDQLKAYEIELEELGL